MMIKKDFNTVHTSATLKRPITPGRWVSDVMYQPITRITMTCGGGLGGSVWCEYVERVPLEALAGLRGGAVFKTWDGKEIMLNTSNMVKAEQFTVASAVLNSQNHNLKTGDYRCCYLVEDGHRLTLVD